MADQELSCPACPPCADLPSSNSAYRLVHGDLSALPWVIRDWAVRAAMGSAGVWISGRLSGQKLSPAYILISGASMSAFIEAFVLTYEATLPPPLSPLAKGRASLRGL